MSLLDPWYAQEMFGFTLPRTLALRVRASGDRATLQVRLIDDTVAEFAASRDTGWVRAADIESLLGMKARGDFRQFTRRAAGSRAAVLAMVDGFTAEEAQLFYDWTYEEVKADQAERDHAVTFMNLKEQALDLAIRNNAGESLTVVGSIVALFPGYGTIIGGVMVMGGVVLTAAQKNEIMKRAALKRKRALLDARLRYLKGEISEAEYLQVQQQVLLEEAQAMLGENALQTMQEHLPQKDRVGEFLETLKGNPVAILVALGVGLVAVYLTWKIVDAFSEA